MAKTVQVLSSLNSLPASTDALTVVDFSAEWCGPCHALAPTLDRLAQELEGDVRFVKIDVDAAPDDASTYKIRSIPTLVFLRQGVEVGRVTGLVSKHDLQKHIGKLLAGPEAQN